MLHFPPSLEEVNLSVSNDRVWLRNHIEDDAGISVKCTAVTHYLKASVFNAFLYFFRFISSDDDRTLFEFRGV